MIPIESPKEMKVQIHTLSLESEHEFVLSEK